MLRIVKIKFCIVCLINLFLSKCFLGISPNEANKILKRMESEGFVNPGGKAKRFDFFNLVLHFVSTGQILIFLTPVESGIFYFAIFL